jgi:pantetheine-phosphate adenylyltransferase
VTLALYPGSFDPITNGHLNLIERGLRVFDRLIVAVAINPAKKPMFTPEERMGLIREAVNNDERIVVDSFTGLLVDYARTHKAQVVLRGLRAISDFEFEFQMTHMNRRLHPGLEMVFMMTDEEYFFVSSGLVREIASFGGKVQGLVPPSVEKKLAERSR